MTLLWKKCLCSGGRDAIAWSATLVWASALPAASRVNIKRFCSPMVLRAALPALRRRRNGAIVGLQSMMLSDFMVMVVGGMFGFDCYHAGSLHRSCGYLLFLMTVVEPSRHFGEGS